VNNAIEKKKAKNNKSATSPGRMGAITMRVFL